MIWLLLFFDLFTPAFRDNPAEIRHFSFQRNREHHGGVWPDDLEGKPPIGERLFAVVDLEDESEIRDIQYWLVDAHERVIEPLGFVRISENVFGGWANVPSLPFRVCAKGRYLDGDRFHAHGALQEPEKRTLPPEIPGGPADEKYRQLTASPAPISVPHAHVIALRHRLDDNRLILDFDVEVSGEGVFHFYPTVSGPTRFSARTIENQRFPRGRHHVTQELAADAAPKPGRYSIAISQTGFLRHVQLP